MRQQRSMLFHGWCHILVKITLLLLATSLHDGLVLACSGRKVLNATSGIITDGTGTYPASADCEWLIVVTDNNKFISLDFVSMETECSYDYLFVYDGLSYESPLLGSFSGKTLPDKLLAQSGHMLIHFYSDRNYMLNGFLAKYSVTSCPFNCTDDRGTCNAESHACACGVGYLGRGCEMLACPDGCGGHGSCNITMQRCDCDSGYLGYDCTLSDVTTSDAGHWSVVRPSGLPVRTGHAGAYVAQQRCLYVFGGNNLNAFLDDLMRYCFAQGGGGGTGASGRWEQMGIQGVHWPPARHGHAMVQWRDNLLMFGGILANGSHDNALWVYDTDAGTWSQHALASAPSGVAHHTLTTVEETWLYLFGGQTERGDFISDMYRIELASLSRWERVDVRRGKEANHRLVGHSAVYHSASRSLLIYGGLTPDYARFPKRSSSVHAFHVDENFWSEIHYDLEEKWDPKDRAFHSAVILGNYMVIYGGNSHIHHHEEVCYDGEVYFYHLGCHRWVLRSSLEKPYREVPSEPPKGRFSTVVTAAFNNVLLITGGYRGNVLGDLMAYTVPKAVARSEGDGVVLSDHCDLHHGNMQCEVDPECVYCEQPSFQDAAKCIHRSRARECRKLDGKVAACRGICAALLDCGSCTVQGQGGVHRNDSNPTLWLNERCAWCVKEAQCQKREVFEGLCNETDVALSGKEGWWGWTSDRHAQLAQCRVADFPAGLHWIEYRFPPDLLQPDKVEIVRETSMHVEFKALFDLENSQGRVYTAAFRGFLHPMGAPSSSGDRYLKVYIVASAAQAWLNMSRNESPATQEEVGQLQAATYDYAEARRLSGQRIFPQEERGTKYYVLEKVEQRIAECGATQVASQLRLEWTGAVSRHRETFSAEFLEPFNGGDCELHSNCLACMTDMACGWCVTSHACVPRLDTERPASQCGAVEGARHLVTESFECPLCADHVECFTCTSDLLCEWLTSEARCLRRGRFDTAVREVDRCPVPCQERTNCSWCVSEKNECAWCDQTRTCFPFMSYVVRYNYGGCSQWVDSMSSQQCHDCAAHTTCADCMTHYMCGWCGLQENPTIGRCLQGDFTGPEIGANCSVHVSDMYHVASEEPSDWSYGVCPDVEECRLLLHDCHDNATCVNSFEAFECHCDRGFMGDGRKTCERTCYYDCIHGTCSGGPEFECMCDVGWTGADCNTNCGCHNHSTCLSGVGACDLCQNWTMGQHCEFCQPGSYGDATAMMGCLECQCNGHGDARQGFCDRTTGTCRCRDHTDGTHCQNCLSGYYGDPRNGGKCYLKCEGRTILGNITSGSLGSHEGQGVSDQVVYCLWILTIHPDLSNIRDLDVIPTITFTMESDIKTRCSRDYVYVYDGIPGFMSNPMASGASLLAAFCGYDYPQGPKSVVAKSGFITVHFDASMGLTSNTRGFNASYHVNMCPDSCHGNRVCRDSACVCADGYGGVDCQTELCPADCSEGQGQGLCDPALALCTCVGDFAGPDCRNETEPDSTRYSLLYDPERLGDPHMTFGGRLARMGHSLVSCDDTKPHRYLYMYGGYSLTGGILGDHWQYDVILNTWTEVTSSSDEAPSPRYFHSAACVLTVRAIFVYGGLVPGLGASNELWKFNIDSFRWTKLQVPSQDSYGVPPLAGHTMTLVDKARVWILGGFSLQDYFSEHDYEYDAALNRWSVLKVSGSKPTGVYGHSAVHHEDSRAVYLFGGYEFRTDQHTISNRLYSLDVRNHSWSEMPSFGSHQPARRFLHEAVTVAEYMVVMGGRSRDKDFDSSVWAYQYHCNEWINLSAGGHNVYGDGIPAVIAARAVALRDHVYHVGGFDSRSQGVLTRLSLPADVCTLYADSDTCLEKSGCAVCTVEETNATFCYDNRQTRPSGCLVENTTVSIQQGATCDVTVINQRICGLFQTCSECLARWPVYQGHAEMCQWCSNCPVGVCVRRGADCHATMACNRPHQVILHTDVCVERGCQAADCDKCGAQQICMWTRQFKRASEVGRTLSLIPIYDWNCVGVGLRNVTVYEVESSPPLGCPPRCFRHTTCTDCLQAWGAEGGSQMCVWSLPLNMCMPPAYLSLRCSSGECGRVLNGGPNPGQCPRRCSIHRQCSQCLASPGCGWCALGGLNGLGVCMEGGLVAPLQGVCNATTVRLSHEALPANVSIWLEHATGPHSWGFGKCPPENECLNDHHDCDVNEACTDNATGFQCDCKGGYAPNQSSGMCEPVCKPGCGDNGRCLQPDVCQCHFGYVGRDCSYECQCNKHSNCESKDLRGVCTECHNLTQGEHCEVCKPLYVGDPQNGGKCQSCAEFCYHHTAVCLSQQEFNFSIQWPGLPLDPENVSIWAKHGPKDKEHTVCIHCANNTQGDHCKDCKDGFFRLNTKLPSDACQPCQCQGHSDFCSKDDGTDCDCKNNTKSPRCDSNKDNECYKKQCSKCVDGFLGTPTGGHQCYRQMNVDRDYCLDPATQMNCNRQPTPLMAGRTVFFVVQPKYLNVDIRITLDITQGGVDAYFSNLESTYIVDVDKESGIHNISIDLKYLDGLVDPQGFLLNQRRRRAAAVAALGEVAGDGGGGDGGSPSSSPAPGDGGGGGGGQWAAEHRGADPNSDDGSHDDPLSVLDNVSNANGNNGSLADPEKYMLLRLSRQQVNTFVVVESPNTLLLIENVQHRLVLTLPNGAHDLKTSRFFLVLYGRGSPDTAVNETFGNLFFRQDQPHIDLFVFFSVFFSCFFLFLAVCVLVWKAKQAYDSRRTRHRRRIEMQSMASRPFARSLVVLESKDPDGLLVAMAMSPPHAVSDLAPLMPLRKSVARLSMPRLGSRSSLGSSGLHYHQPPASTHPFQQQQQLHQNQNQLNLQLAQQYASATSVFLSTPLGGGGTLERDCAFTVQPIALEPTEDGVAAIGTFFLELPVCNEAPVCACLGSALLTMRQLHPNPHHSHKAIARRRPSYTMAGCPQ